MARKGRGGSRTPNNPAPVSGPGALARRTDGLVPKVEPSGLPHGQRKQLREQREGAPVDPQSSPLGPMGPSGVPGQAPPSVFRPTERPDEDPLQVLSAQSQPPPFPNDPDAMLRAIYSAYPHPDIEALLRRE